MHRTIFFALVYVASLLPTSVHAAMNGTIVGIEANGGWTPGRPVIMDIPAISSVKVLSQSKVIGPCFSPVTADSVAFINTDQNSEIQIVRSDGTSTQPLRTGILLNLARGGVGEGRRTATRSLNSTGCKVVFFRRQARSEKIKMSISWCPSPRPDTYSSRYSAVARTTIVARFPDEQNSGTTNFLPRDSSSPSSQRVASTILSSGGEHP